MDSQEIHSKSWSVDVTFRGETKTYTIKDFSVLSEPQVKNIAFLMFIEDIKGELAEEVQFEITPADPNFVSL